MQGYAVTWCETGTGGKRVKRREDHLFKDYTRIGALDIAQLHAKRLRGLGYAACVEEIL